MVTKKGTEEAEEEETSRNDEPTEMKLIVSVLIFCLSFGFGPLAGQK